MPKDILGSLKTSIFGPSLEETQQALRSDDIQKLSEMYQPNFISNAANVVRGLIPLGLGNTGRVQGMKSYVNSYLRTKTLLEENARRAKTQSNLLSQEYNLKGLFEQLKGQERRKLEEYKIQNRPPELTPEQYGERQGISAVSKAKTITDAVRKGKIPYDQARDILAKDMIDSDAIDKLLGGKPETSELPNLFAQQGLTRVQIEELTDMVTQIEENHADWEPGELEVAIKTAFSEGYTMDQVFEKIDKLYQEIQ